MALPITSFVELTQNVVEWGKQSILQNPRPEDPPALASQKRDPRVLALKKAIPIELTEQEKKFDHTFTQYLFNEILIGKYLREISRQLIEEDHLLYFAQQEKQKALIELLTYLREKAENKQQMEKQIDFSKLKDNPDLQETIEKILALQHLIAELEERKQALIAHREKYVSDFIVSMAEKIGKVEGFEDFTAKELQSTVAPVTQIMLMKAREKARILARYQQNNPAGDPMIWGRGVQDTTSEHINQQLVQTYYDMWASKGKKMPEKTKNEVMGIVKEGNTLFSRDVYETFDKEEKCDESIAKIRNKIEKMKQRYSVQGHRVEAGKKEVMQGENERNSLDDILNAIGDGYKLEIKPSL